jgi:hypothetical protein
MRLVPPEGIYIAGDGTFGVPAHGLAPDRNEERGASWKTFRASPRGSASRALQHPDRYALRTLPVPRGGEATGLINLTAMVLSVRPG